MLHKEKILATVDFADLVKVSSKIILEANPVGATQMGLISYNNLWPDISTYGVRRDIEILQAIQEKLNTLHNGITEEMHEDYELLTWFVEINLLELEEFQFWRSAHLLASTILGGIHSLITKKEPSKQFRAQSVVARLGSIQALIAGEQERLTNPVSVWVHTELKSIEGLLDFLQSLSEIFDDVDMVTKKELHAVLIEVEEKLTDHRLWLEQLDTQEELPVNPEAYRKLIKLRKLGYDDHELEELGEYYLRWTADQLAEIAHKLCGDNIATVRQQIRSKHATDFDEVVMNYKTLAQRARSLIKEKDLLSMPEENLEVIFTPKPMRNFLSIAAAGTPGKFDSDQTGYFYCTPHEDEKMLEEHSYAYQPLLISHESYPGHHVHGACKNQHPSLVRTAIFTHPSANTGFMYSSKLADITEGWGLYCEEMMYNHGFENDLNNPDYEQLFLQINAMRWRAARMVIDVNLHTGKMNFSDAVEYLREQTGYHATTARAEIMMYSRSPGYFSSYLLGKHLLTSLKSKVADKLTEKEFHDTLLYAGNVPYWFVHQKLLED